MANAQVHTLRATKDCGWTALALVQLPSGSYITQATIDTIRCIVKNQAGTITYNQLLTVANVVYDTLQTSDARWTSGATGCNFIYEVPASAFGSAGHHRAEFHFTPVTGEAFAICFEGGVMSRFDTPA